MEETPIEILAPQPVETIAPPQGPGWMRILLDILETLLLSAALFLVINALSARVRVDGISMNPTLQNGELVLVNRLAYRLGDYQRGDIVVFHFTSSPPQDLIKRIIGLPGDQVDISEGRVLVNGILLDEPYISAPPLYDGSWIVPDGHIFVLGDNRNDSSDSHSWGMLAMEKVMGKAVLVYWPMQNWSLIDHYNYNSLKATE